MAQTLAEIGKIRLAVIAQGKVKSATRYDCNNVKQWLVPFEPLNRYGLPSNKTIESIKLISDKIKPDIIHIWAPRIIGVC